MSLAIKLNLEDINENEVRKLIEEDAQAFCSMFYTYFSIKGESFAELDQYIQDHDKTIYLYVQKIQSSNEWKDFPPQEQKIFNIQDFRRRQRSHIETLSQYEDPQISKILHIKKNLLSEKP